VNGHIIQSYSDAPTDSTTTGGQLNVPCRLAVDVDEFIYVVDYNNRRVLLLSSTLSCVRQVVSASDLQLVEGAWPHRLCLDVNKRRLYVGVSEEWNGKKWTAGRVVVVSL
jgi:hypothetical protein